MPAPPTILQRVLLLLDDYEELTSTLVAEKFKITKHNARAKLLTLHDRGYLVRSNWGIYKKSPHRDFPHKNTWASLPI